MRRARPRISPTAEERLGQDRAPVRAVVERALEHVGGGVLPGDVGETGEQPGERADAFAHDRVAFERHRRTADLLASERLEHLAEAGRRQNPNVDGKLREGGGDTGKRREHEVVDLARVGLRAHAGGLQVECLEDLALLVCRRAAGAAQQMMVRRGRADGPADPLRRHAPVHVAQHGVVEEQILSVDGQPIADGRRLGGL